jgi:hypothetical protein
MTNQPMHADSERSLRPWSRRWWFAGATAAITVAASPRPAQAAPTSPCIAHDPDGLCSVALDNGAIALAASISSAGAARAPANPRLHWLSPEPPMKRVEWYGWQVLAADASWMVLAPLVGIAGKSFPMGAVTGLGGYLLAGPLAHAAQGNGNAVLESALVRVTWPIFGGLVVGLGFGTEDGGTEWFLKGAAVGAGLGAVCAIIYDAATNSTSIVTVDGPRRAARKAPGFSIVPTADVAHLQQTIGVQGTF